MTKNKNSRQGGARTTDRPGQKTAAGQGQRPGSKQPVQAARRKPDQARPQGAGHRPQHGHGSQNQGGQRPQRDRAGLSPETRDGYFLFGRHAVEAALKNPARDCVRLIGLQKVLDGTNLADIRPRLRVEVASDEDMIRSAVPSDSPHQGILLEVRPLPGLAVDELAPVAGQKNIILMLDQVTDPHNVGACLRSAAAFGARALITQDRHSPGESGTLARSSSGGLEVTPWVRVANLAQTLDQLKDMGYWHVGLDGDTETALRDVDLGDNIVLVMGSEGSGLRQLTRRQCDAIAKIPMTGTVESLNVSNAAAIALYELAGL